MKIFKSLQLTWRLAAYSLAALMATLSLPSTAAAATPLVGKGSGLCLDLAGFDTSLGAPIDIWACNGGSNQQWEFTGAGEVRTLNGTRCLDAYAGGTSNGTRVVSYTCNGGANQKWTLQGNGQLVGQASGLCVDVIGGGTANGSQVALWSCHGGSNQTWSQGGGGSCNAVEWQAGKNYQLGNVVHYGNGYYKVVNVTANGTDATIPTISTWYWAPTTCGGGGGGGGGNNNSGKIVGGYYPNWKPSAIRIRELPASYNLVYLFAAVPVGGPPGSTGAVTFAPPGDGRGAASNLNADIAYARKSQGRKIILSVGGAGQGMSFPNRGKSQNFVNSIVGIYNQLGGIDGIDWNTFEGSQAPDTNEMIWISKELKAKFPGFLVSAPPAPWNAVDKNFCKAMVDAGALDYAAPQYYDGPNLATQSYMVNSVNEWVNLLGASHVVVGFGINTSLPNYMNRDQAIATWNQIKSQHPDIRGAFDWEVGTDETQGWPFANFVGPLVK